MLRRVARGGRFSRRHHGEPQSPFEAPAGGRPLRLVLDLTTTPRGEALDLLLSFAYHSEIEILEYRGAAVTGTRASPEPREGAGELRLSTVCAEISDSDGFLTVGALRDGRTTRTVVGERRALINIARETTTVPLDEATTGLALCWATDSLGFDALVTGSPAVLNELPENFVSRGNPLTSGDGCWLLGLYLRLREDYTFEMGESHSVTGSRSGYFFELTRELLPASWRWFSACARAWDEDRTTDLIGLGMSGLERFDRALRARDRVNVLRQLPDDEDVIDEEIFAFDVLLLMLSAVFDVAAMVATRSYALPVDDHRVGWRQSGWRKELRKADRALYDLTETSAPARDAIDAVAHLRNMVHGEALRSEFHWNRWPRRHRVRVPANVTAKLTSTAQRQGGLDAFGLEVSGLGLYVDPGVYAERRWLSRPTRSTISCPQRRSSASSMTPRSC